MENFEEKYTDIIEGNRELWFDIHSRKGSGEIDENTFREELLKLGITEADALSYIQSLNAANTMVGEILEGFNMEEMADIFLKYDNLAAYEPKILEAIKGNNFDAARELLKKEVNMEDSEVDIVLNHFRFQIQLDQKFNFDSTDSL